MDGILVPPTMPFLRADDAGVLRGDGVFETTLVVDGIVRDLAEHLERLQQSARALDLALPEPSGWRPAIDAAVAGWAAGREMVLRLVATRGPLSADEPTCYAIGSAPDATTLDQRDGVAALLLDRGYAPGAGGDSQPYLLTAAKTVSYAINMAALRYARSRGADDVIFVDAAGAVLDGATSTVVIAHGRSLVIPRQPAALRGITAGRLLAAAASAGWTVREDEPTAETLASADGVYLTSSVRLLAPVTSIDGAPRENDPAVTAELRRLLDVPGDADDVPGDAPDDAPASAVGV